MTYICPAVLLLFAMVMLCANAFAQPFGKDTSYMLGGRLVTVRVCIEMPRLETKSATGLAPLLLANHQALSTTIDTNIEKRNNQRNATTPYPGSLKLAFEMGLLPDDGEPANLRFLYDWINNIEIGGKGKRQGQNNAPRLSFNLSGSFEYVSLYGGFSMATQSHSYFDIGRKWEKPLPGFGAGLGACFGLTEKLSIIPSLGYDQKGCLAKFYRIYSKPTNKFYYLHFGLPLQLRFYENMKYKCYGKIGPKVNFLVADIIGYDVDPYSQNLHFEIHHDNYPYTYLTDTPYPDNSKYKDFKPYNVGGKIVFGAIADKKWQMEISYELDYLINQPDFRVWNQLWAVSLGYVIGMK